MINTQPLSAVLSRKLLAETDLHKNVGLMKTNGSFKKGVMQPTVEFCFFFISFFKYESNGTFHAGGLEYKA